HNLLFEYEHVHAADEPGLGMRSDHFQRGADRLGVVHVHSGQERVGVAARYHAHAEVVRVVQLVMRFTKAQTLALAPLPEIRGVLVAERRRGGIFESYVGNVDAVTTRDVLDVARVADQDLFTDPLVKHLLCGTYDLWLVAFGEDDALGVALCAIDQAANDSARAAEPSFQLIAVFVEVDELVGRATRNRGPRHGGRDPQQNARIEREGDQIVGPEVHRLQSVQACHALGDVFLCEVCKRASRGHLHYFVHFRCAHVQRTAEDERE